MRISIRLPFLRIFTQTTENQLRVLGIISLTVMYYLYLTHVGGDGFVFSLFTNSLVFLVMKKRLKSTTPRPAVSFNPS